MLGTRPTYNGIKDVFRKVYLEGGIRSLYRGVGMSSYCKLFERYPCLSCLQIVFPFPLPLSLAPPPQTKTSVLLAFKYLLIFGF